MKRLTKAAKARIARDNALVEKNRALIAPVLGTVFALDGVSVTVVLDDAIDVLSDLTPGQCSIGLEARVLVDGLMYARYPMHLNDTWAMFFKFDACPSIAEIQALIETHRTDLQSLGMPKRAA